MGIGASWTVRRYAPLVVLDVWILAVPAAAAIIFAAPAHADREHDYLLYLQSQGIIILPVPNGAAPHDGAAPWLALGYRACDDLHRGGGEPAAVQDLSTWDSTSPVFRNNPHAVQSVVAGAHLNLCPDA
jgi:hypothetical protein